MNRRRAARFGAVQALYQAEVTGQHREFVLAEFQAFRLADLLEPLELDEPAQEVDRDWFARIAGGAAAATATLDPMIEKTLSAGWSLDRLGFLVRAFLRAGAFEMAHCPDVPLKVVINEYVELAHAFLGAEDPGFINAVLDRLAAELRPEHRAAAPAGA
jgi:N utilization substance protein B